MNGFLFGVDRSKSARNEEPSSRGALSSGLTSADSGLQLNLEIALSGASAKIQRPPAFQPGRKCVETSDDVIEDDFTSTPGTRILDLSPMRLGAAKTKGNGRKRPVFLTADAQRYNGKRFIVTADEKLTAFLELERMT